MDKRVRIGYTNWKGVRGVRIITPDVIYYGEGNQYHPEAQWFLRAFDEEKQDWRDFSLKDIHKWESEEM